MSEITVPYGTVLDCIAVGAKSTVRKKRTPPPLLSEILKVVVVVIVDVVWEKKKNQFDVQVFSFLNITRQRPYHVESTASRPISEVKQRWVWIVLGWVTAWEHQMLLAF